MEHKIVPVFKELFKLADDTGNLRFDRPIAVQITKFKTRDSGLALRLSDGEFTLASILQPELDYSFAEVRRIVQLTKFEVGCTDVREPGKEESRRVYLNILDWTDLGPSNLIVGYPSQMNGTHVTGHGCLRFKKDPPAAAGQANSTSSTGSVAPAASAHASTAALATSGDDLNGNPSRGLNGSRAKSAKQLSVESLSPFVSNWVLLARVTKKSDIREFTSANNNTGQVFNMTLNDETGDIAATGFSDAVKKFYYSIIEGQQYYFSKFNVRNSNPKFNQTSHSYELIFSNDSQVELATDTEKQLPSVFFKFVDSIADLAKHQVDSNVDVVAVASKIGDAQVITSKSSSIPYTKRDIVLMDDSGRTVTLTLWGNDAEKFSSPPGTVLGVKGARLSDFNGLSLSVTRSALVYTDPDDKRAHKLKGWWQATGGSDVKHEPLANLKDEAGQGSQSRETSRLLIQQIFEKGVGRSDKPDWFQVKARISSISQRTIAYPSCTIGDCKKKVIEESDGQWRCEKCETTMPEPRWRFILNFVLSDPSSEDLGIQVTAFDEIGQKIYGDKARDFVEIQGQSRQGDFNRDLANALRVAQGREYLWTIKGTLDHYNGNERLRFTVMSLEQPDPFVEGSKMLGEIGF